MSIRLIPPLNNSVSVIQCANSPLPHLEVESTTETTGLKKKKKFYTSTDQSLNRILQDGEPEGSSTVMSVRQGPILRFWMPLREGHRNTSSPTCRQCLLPPPPRPAGTKSFGSELVLTKIYSPSSVSDSPRRVLLGVQFFFSFLFLSSEFLNPVTLLNP